MKSLTIKSISPQPVKKETKAPFVVSALICGDVVGFCLSDFCGQIVEQYKKNLISNLAPEYIFSRLVLTLSKSKYRHHGRRISLELMMLMNSPYRPWYICDKDPGVAKLLSDVGISLSCAAYDAFPKFVKGGIQHPYLALVLSQHLSDKVGIKSFFGLDAFTLVDNIRHLINKKCLYRTCVEIGYFKRDHVLLQLFEFLVEGLDGHKLAKYKAAVDQFSRDLHYVLGSKSQLLILKCYSLGSRNPCFRSSINEFERSVNYSTKNEYKIPFYRMVIGTAITTGDWPLFDKCIGIIKADLGDSDPIVKSLVNKANVERYEKPQECLNSAGYQVEIAQGLELEKAIRDVSFMREVEYYRSYHLLSPTYKSKVSITEVSTECLINLMILLSSLKACHIKRDVLDRVAIQLMYPEDSVTWGALSELISSKVVKLNLKEFEKIPVKALNNIESYFGMSFRLNLEEINLYDVDSLKRIEAAISTRHNLESALLAVWSKYVESHFYAAIDDYAPKANCEIDKKRDIGTQFKIKLRKNKLSANTLRLVVYQSIAQAVKSNGNPSGAGFLGVKKSLSLNLTRYLHEAEQGGFEDLPSLPKNSNIPFVEQILSVLSGLNGHELYSYKPKAKFLPKVNF